MNNEFTKAVYDAICNRERKRLIARTLYDNGDVCAVGALLASGGYGEDTKLRKYWFERTTPEEEASWCSIVAENNMFVGSPEERYEHMKQWLAEKLGLVQLEEKEPVNA